MATSVPRIALLTLALWSLAIAAPVRSQGFAALKPGDRIARAIAAGESHVYPLEAPRGAVFAAILSANTVTVTATIERADGTPLFEDRERVPVMMLDPGYRVVVRASKGPSATYELRLDASRAGTAADEEAFAAWTKAGEGRRLLRTQTEAALEQARGLFEDAATTFDRLNDRRGRFVAWAGLTDVWDQRSDQARIVDAAQHALDAARELEDPLLEADARTWLGSAQASTGNLAAALTNARTALDVARRHRDRIREGAIVVNVSYVLTQSGSTRDDEEAAAILEQVLPLLKDIGDFANESTADNNLGTHYAMLGDGERALRYHEQALGIRREHGLRNFEAYSLSNIGTTLGDTLKRPAEAVPYFEQTLAVRREVGDRGGLGGAYEGLCKSLHQLKRPAEARPQCEQALAFYREFHRARGEANVQLRLGQIALDLGELDTARKQLLVARDLASKASAATSETQALLALSRVAKAANDLPAARDWAEAAVARIEDARAGVVSAAQRASYFAQLRGAYELYTDLLVRGGDDAAAFRMSERARARTLIEAVAADDRARPPATVPAMAAADVRSLLDSDTTLIEYQLTPDRSFAWVVTASGVRTVVLASATDIEDAVRRVVDLITARNATVREDLRERRARVERTDREADDAVRALADLVIAPLNLGPGRRLAVVADGALHYVPFTVLPDSRTGRPMADTRDIVALPSASALAALREPRNRQTENRIAVIADPVFTRADGRFAAPGAASPDAAARIVLRSAAESGLSELPRLRFSREEADAIASLVPSSRQLLLTDFRASRDAVLGGELARARVVHFATHGILNSVHPELSGLVLSMVDERGAARDGFLRVSDIEDLRLGAELVVLSACQTALGKQVRGEGIVGLTRGFMLAGAPRVLASLWRVQDQATAELMTHFYRAYLGDGMSAAAALRQAQQALAADPRWRSPYYWAGFMLYGDWQ